MKNYISVFACIVLLFSCSENKEFYTLEDYYTTKKTDVHVHISSDRPYFVEKAKADNFHLLNVALETKNGWDDVYSRYNYGREQQENFPETVDVVTSFSVADWDDPSWEKRVISFLDSCFEKGAVGVKVWKNIGMVSRDSADNLIFIDDPKFEPIINHIQMKDKTLMGHLGEPKNCWLPLDSMTTNNDRRYFSRNPEYHMYLQPEMPSYEELVASRDRMLEKHPELRFVGAHLGSLEWSVDELAKRLDKFPKMAVELAARMGQVFYQTVDDREKVRDFFIKYQDRILYGTDLADGGSMSEEELKDDMENTWKRDWEYFVTDNQMESDLINSPFQGLKLPKEVVDKIYFKNANYWFAMNLTE